MPLLFNADSLLHEIWKSIPSTDNVYWASTFGRIKSFRRYVDGQLLNPVIGSHGYPVVNIANGSRVNQTTVPIHKLVAEAFFGLCPDNLIVNHKDSDKTNACPENLEYITQAENLAYAARNGRMQRGELRWNARLTPDLVRYIRCARKTKPVLAVELNIGLRTIYDVLQGRTWKHVI